MEHTCRDLEAAGGSLGTTSAFACDDSGAALFSEGPEGFAGVELLGCWGASWAAGVLVRPSSSSGGSSGDGQRPVDVGPVRSSAK